MDIVEEILATRVVNQKDRKRELVGPGTGLGTHHATSGLLTGAQHVRQQFRTSLMEQFDDVPAIVNDNVWRYIQRHAHHLPHFLRACAMTRIDMQTLCSQGSHHFVLG